MVCANGHRYLVQFDETDVMVYHVHRARRRLADLVSTFNLLRMVPYTGPCDSAHHNCSACIATLAQEYASA